MVCTRFENKCSLTTVGIDNHTHRITWLMKTFACGSEQLAQTLQALLIRCPRQQKVDTPDHNFADQQVVFEKLANKPKSYAKP